MAVLGVLDHSEDLAGEAGVQFDEGGGEVATDVQKNDGLAGRAGFEVVQRGVRVGEQGPGESVDRGGCLDLSLGAGSDGFGLGSTARSWVIAATARTKAGRSGSRWVTRKDVARPVGANWAVFLLK